VLTHQLGEAVDEPVADTAYVDDVADGAGAAELATEPAGVRVECPRPRLRAEAPDIARDRR
jgi:hypothetical protein